MLSKLRVTGVTGSRQACVARTSLLPAQHRLVSLPPPRKQPIGRRNSMTGDSILEKLQQKLGLQAGLSVSGPDTSAACASFEPV